LQKLAQEVERESRATETPAKTAFVVTNIPAATTTLDGATAVLADVINFLGGFTDTFVAKGIIRTKSRSEG
jgi:hypothetical protein